MLEFLRPVCLLVLTDFCHKTRFLQVLRTQSMRSDVLHYLNQLHCFMILVFSCSTVNLKGTMLILEVSRCVMLAVLKNLDMVSTRCSGFSMPSEKVTGSSIYKQCEKCFHGSSAMIMSTILGI